jgi:hypothetical protein
MDGFETETELTIHAFERKCRCPAICTGLAPNVDFRHLQTNEDLSGTEL